MKIRRIYFAVMMMLVYCSTTFSQGEFLKQGQSGIGLSSGFSSITSDENIGGNSVYGSFGYSYRTMIDFNISYAKGHPSQSKTLTPSVSFYLSKQNEVIDETVAITLILQHIVNPDAYQRENSLGLALSIAHDFLRDTSHILQPNISFSIYPSYKQREGTKTLTTVSAGISIGYQFNSDYYFIVTPSIAYQDGYAILGGSLAFVFNTSSSN